MTYRFGLFQLDAQHMQLTRNGRAISLTRQTAQLLLQLVESSGEVVSREAIRAHLWGHSFLEVDPAINQCVRRLRAALDDDPRKPLYVETLPRRGYRFICPVEVRADSTAQAPPTRMIRATGTIAGAALVGGLALALVVPASRTWSRDLEANAGAAGSGALLAQASARLDRREPSLVERAIADLESAAAGDPANGALQARLAVAHSRLFWYSGRPQAARAARHHLRRAEALGVEQGNVWLTRGVLSFHDRDYASAVSALERARDADSGPGHAEIDLMLGKTLRRTGRWDDAMAALQRAHEANPLSFEATYAVASTARYMGRHELARRFIALARDLDATNWVTWAIRPVDALREDGDVARAAALAEESSEEIGRGMLFATSQALSRVLSHVAIEGEPFFEGPEGYRGSFYLSLGEAFRVRGLEEAARAQYDSAVFVLERQLAEDSWAESHRGQRLSWLASAEAGRGNRAGALARAEEATKALPLDEDAFIGSVIQIQVAQTLAVVGELDRAADIVRALLEGTSPLTPALLRVDPIWEPVRDHPALAPWLGESDGAPEPRRRRTS